MRDLSSKEIFVVAGGNAHYGEEHSYSREFWTSVVHSSGTMVGVFSSPFVFVGMVGYGIFYGVSTVIGGIFSGIYSAGSYIVGGSSK